MNAFVETSDPAKACRDPACPIAGRHLHLNISRGPAPEPRWVTNAKCAALATAISVGMFALVFFIFWLDLELELR